MTFPLKKLIECNKNMYEVTAAASRRSYQLTMLLDKETKEEDFEGKMVTLAANQVFSEEIEYRIEAE